jgi:hypothetical protein
LLDAFRQVCEKVTDWNQLSTAASQSGWQVFDEAANPQLARINRIGREAVGTEGRMLGTSFRRTLAGRTVFLVVSRWEGARGIWGNGCRLYDFTAAAPVNRDLLVAWMGRAPTGNQSFGQAGSNLLWEPGWRDGLTVSVNHVPATSAFRERYGLSGNVLVAQALGGI